ncbi:MAG: class I SAM-dependent methyltransferase [Silicimonas sp.]|nr:class I SAM-dependent methyltransferase [Silicimonas sp.]
MTGEVQAQYEAFPYPARDPKDETRRLITGSPSLPAEMDHNLWGGARNWREPLDILVAGGGTGDGLIQLCQMLTAHGRPYRATYLDLSRAARAIAEERARIRGLENITFRTGSLLEAGDLGRFDYIDCCGVLHHLPEPQAGFNALAAALRPGGGIGLMVYAPLGRSGVYPLQAAFGEATRDLEPKAKLARAREIFARLPETHPFRKNPHLVDHRESDAGFYDLLLHSQDRPYTITELVEALTTAGLELAGMAEPALYDPTPFLGGEGPEMDPVAAMQLAENLRGSIKVHVAYAVPEGGRIKPPLGQPGAVPRLRGIDPRKLAQAVAKTGALTLTSEGNKTRVEVPKAAGPILAAIGGGRDLGAIRAATKLDPFAFNAAWGQVERLLTSHGLLHYSKV